MPAAGEQKWTINEALKYRQELATLYGANGSREQIRQYFVSDKKLGWDEGFEYTLQKYETRAAKTANKISQETYKNKHGIVEKREDLIRRKVEKDIGRAESVNTQLVQLGRYLECMSTGATFIPGPIKKFDSAIRKTMGDNKGIWTDNKDLARCTIAHEYSWGVASIASEILRVCQPPYGMKLIKAKERKPIPTDDNPLAYSDWNFVVVFKGSKIPAEIQVNTFAMMYGKMSKDDYTRAILGEDRAKYERDENEFNFPGGLGHLLYEIVRDEQSTADEKKGAKEMGVWYHNLCRMGPAERAAEAKECCDRYQKFCDSLTTAFAKKVVKDHPLDAKWGVRV